MNVKQPKVLLLGVGYFPAIISGDKQARESTVEPYPSTMSDAPSTAEVPTATMLPLASCWTTGIRTDQFERLWRSIRGRSLS